MAKSLFDLAGKVAVVTGGNGGLGLGFARGIARQGGDVVIWGRSPEKNAQAKAELETFGGRVGTRVVNVAAEQEVIDGFDAVLDDFGRIDCVVANAGLPPQARSVFDLTTEKYMAFVDIGMHGAFFTLKEGARRMVARAEAGDPGGSLIFCGSLSMFLGFPGKQDYAGSKAAVGAMVRCFAIELGKYGIRANTVAPGFVKTGMTVMPGEAEQSEVWTAIDKHMAAKTPIPRPGYPADYEGIAAYLCSDASAFHSGDTIVIDGASVINFDV